MTEPSLRPICCGRPMWINSRGIHKRSRGSWIKFRCSQCRVMFRWRELSPSNVPPPPPWKEPT